MTARLELERIARTVVPPVGVTDVCLVVTGKPGERLTSGAPAGRGGTTRYGAAWVIGGRGKSEPIATFDRHVDAAAFADILEGRTSRPPAASRVSPTQPRSPTGRGRASRSDSASGFEPS